MRVEGAGAPHHPQHAVRSHCKVYCLLFIVQRFRSLIRQVFVIRCLLVPNKMQLHTYYLVNIANISGEPNLCEALRDAISRDYPIGVHSENRNEALKC